MMTDAEVKEGVANTMLDYCECLDELRLDDFMTLFTDDIEFEEGGLAVGKPHVRAKVRKLLDLFHCCHHHLSNIRVTRTGETTARSSAYIYAWHNMKSWRDPWRSGAAISTNSALRTAAGKSPGAPCKCKVRAGWSLSSCACRFRSFRRKPPDGPPLGVGAAPAKRASAKRSCAPRSAASRVGSRRGRRAQHLRFDRSHDAALDVGRRSARHAHGDRRSGAQLCLGASHPIQTSPPQGGGYRIRPGSLGGSIDPARRNRRTQKLRPAAERARQRAGADRPHRLFRPA